MLNEGQSRGVDAEVEFNDIVQSLLNAFVEEPVATEDVDQFVVLSAASVFLCLMKCK